MRLIRVMCTGRLDLLHLLRAFERGADGVFVGGCHLNECNYTTHGNFHALSLVGLGRGLLECAGVNPDRLRIELISSGEGTRFADVMNDFGRTVRHLGPLGRGEGLAEGHLGNELQRLNKLAPYVKIAMRDKLRTRLAGAEEYAGLYTRGEVEELLERVPTYYIDPAKCQACTTCARRCPVEAIEGGKNLVHVVDQEKCIRCGTCHEACPSRFGAVAKLVGRPAPPPFPPTRGV